MIEPREAIQKLKAYKPPLDARSNKYRYDFNENVLGASPMAIQALREIDPLKLSTYPEYEGYYMQISKHFGVNPDQIMLSNGTDEGIKLILETYMEPGDEMILPTPSFAMFSFYASRLDLDIKEVLYNHQDLSFPTDAVLESITEKTRMVVLVNPNNPTGTPISQEDIETIINKASHALVLIDEAYYDFAKSNSLQFLEKYDNIIILRTFSKSLGLAGLRIGMAMSSPATIGVLRKSSSPYNVSAIACYAAVAALSDEAFSKRYITTVKQSREIVSQTLSDWGYKVYPSDANFILVNFGYQHSWILRYLRKNDILVRDRSSYPLLDNCIRLTMGAQEDRERLLKAIDEARSTIPLIFDMDGVLVDVAKSYRQAIVLTVEKFTGTIPKPGEIQNLKNQGGYNNDWKLTQKLVSELGKEIDLEEITEVFQQFYHGRKEESGLIDEEEWLMDPQELEELSRNHPIYILTGRPREEAEFALEKSETAKLIDGMIAMDDIPEGRSKPDPWGLKQFLELYNSPTAYYFGDSVDDIEAAKSANIEAIGILPPQADGDLKNVLQSAGAKRVISISMIREVIP